MISCEKFDYIEIACLYNYQVELILRTGERVTGIAKDTVTGKSEEHIVLNIDNVQQQISLEDVSMMNVLTPSAQFKTVNF